MGSPSARLLNYNSPGKSLTTEGSAGRSRMKASRRRPRTRGEPCGASLQRACQHHFRLSQGRPCFGAVIVKWKLMGGGVGVTTKKTADAAAPWLTMDAVLSVPDIATSVLSFFDLRDLVQARLLNKNVHRCSQNAALVGRLALQTLGLGVSRSGQLLSADDAVGVDAALGAGLSELALLPMRCSSYPKSVRTGFFPALRITACGPPASSLAAAEGCLSFRYVGASSGNRAVVSDFSFPREPRHRYSPPAAPFVYAIPQASVPDGVLPQRQRPGPPVLGLRLTAYFEVSIASPPVGLGGAAASHSSFYDFGCVAVGLARRGFPLRGLMPGWDSHSVGYHSDDGHLFQGSGMGRRFASTFGRGDVVGCGISYVGSSRCPVRLVKGRPGTTSADRGSSMGASLADFVLADAPCVFFTLNGVLVGHAQPLDVRHGWHAVVGMDVPDLLTVNFGASPFRFPLRDAEACLLRHCVFAEDALSVGLSAPALPRAPLWTGGGAADAPPLGSAGALVHRVAWELTCRRRRLRAHREATSERLLAASRIPHPPPAVGVERHLAAGVVAPETPSFAVAPVALHTAHSFAAASADSVDLPDALPPPPPLPVSRPAWWRADSSPHSNDGGSNSSSASSSLLSPHDLPAQKRARLGIAVATASWSAPAPREGGSWRPTARAPGQRETGERSLFQPDPPHHRRRLARLSDPHQPTAATHDGGDAASAPRAQGMDHALAAVMSRVHRGGSVFAETREDDSGSDTDDSLSEGSGSGSSAGSPRSRGSRSSLERESSDDDADESRDELAGRRAAVEDGPFPQGSALASSQSGRGMLGRVLDGPSWTYASAPLAVPSIDASVGMRAAQWWAEDMSSESESNDDTALGADGPAAASAGPPGESNTSRAADFQLAAERSIRSILPRSRDEHSEFSEGAAARAQGDSAASVGVTASALVRAGVGLIQAAAAVGAAESVRLRGSSIEVGSDLLVPVAFVTSAVFHVSRS